ncbi:MULTISPECIES: YhjD/YihY/BrkB family envelope integrity protein [unclassified Treponema]|uniref:YhjD/YihY/BrkB family envelope integrity protein n=1 Tax=unclassified Treponema TaxID=2638727 RepID=UPI0020A2FFBE|nr:MULTISPECIES: YhjD/YihY/BrkB family envelope integrity protein [unclassified Treponema]UTC66874.1 YihY/virulence factor BrkB family protein [Treponema sp. OMZ 789]UTC69603.1 YihY/virulence factor BrkB family protein [Treponema sp. OMZ 790]UTC72317.1 YihY/virulence factor BrkB family protein [Treponema sp. OMZ 791]
MKKRKTKSQKFLAWYTRVVQEQKKGLYDFNQKIYVTILSFANNDLLTTAAAGAYNFLMSALPIFILTLTVLLRVLKQSPQQVKEAIKALSIFQNTIDLDRFFSFLLSINSFSFFDFIVFIFVLWMARRFFATIQHSIRKVYRKKVKITPLKTSLIVILGEIIVVIFLVFLFIFLITGSAVFRSDFVQPVFSANLLSLLRNLFRFVPVIFMQLFVCLIYYFMPPIKPPFKTAFGSSAACTISYYLIKIFFTFFRSTAKFTFVYGLFTNVILVLMQVWFFFFFFVFFAQFMYVNQFFNSFIISQLYRLPKEDAPGFFNQFLRHLFIEPPKEYRKKAIFIKEGTFIFNYDDKSTEIYYIIEGSVRVITSNKILDLGKGDLFGEFACLLNGRRTGTAVAKTDCLLAVVPKKQFLETISIDGNVSRQALKILAESLIDTN